jgi:hypothetical protein
MGAYEAWREVEFRSRVACCKCEARAEWILECRTSSMSAPAFYAYCETCADARQEAEA